MNGFGRIAGLLRAVEHGGNAAGRAKAASFVLALGGADDCVENCFHDCLSSGFGRGLHPLSATANRRSRLTT